MGNPACIDADMSQPQLPPIYRDCRRLLLHTEASVQRFSRYHKYTVGTDLRQHAMALMRGVHLAVYDKANQPRHIQALVWQVDAYKLTLQLAVDIGAFVHGKAGQQHTTAPGFAAFETAALLAAQIGKQCGGWQKAVGQPTAHAAQAADARYAQAAGASASAAGPKPVVSPRARPASLSEHTTPPARAGQPRVTP
jgi:hypothetical protein